MFKQSYTHFKCKICKSVFRTLNVMQHCMWSHSGHRNYSDLSCQICKTRFATKDGIRKHIHQVHEAGLAHWPRISRTPLRESGRLVCSPGNTVTAGRGPTQLSHKTQTNFQKNMEMPDELENKLENEGKREESEEPRVEIKQVGRNMITLKIQLVQKQLVSTSEMTTTSLNSTPGSLTTTSLNSTPGSQERRTCSATCAPTPPPGWAT